jgi:hypothetical protein
LFDRHDDAELVGGDERVVTILDVSEGRDRVPGFVAGVSAAPE